ncbi:MAG TPA: aspartate/glutamate racemase family protein [Archaeoglobaceae archaeon]|nr:aspartate/glutamate racemase family protein [Archaeoglobaceae archaeon]
MKTIGLLGGMSWQSTVEYYRIVNELVSQKLGKLHSAKCLLYSFDFEEIAERQRRGEWYELAGMLSNAAKNLENSGANMILICTNTMHKVADTVSDAIDVPLINIIDVTAERIKKAGLKKVGLLGTKFTMEDGFYTNRLEENGLSPLIPEPKERDFIHSVIFNELCKGIIKEESKDRFLKIIQDLISRGAEGIILGCTEIPLLIGEEDVYVEIFDTTRIHAEYAVEFALV